MSSTASAARIAANKANALKFTGPRTPEGKAAVAANALKHGLRSERNPLDLASDVTLPHERDEFEATLSAFLQDLQPHGPLETRLVQRLAQIDLRLNRAIRMETTQLEMQTLQTQAEATAAGSSLATDTGRTRDSWLLTMSFLRDPAALKLISQYESRLARDFARTLTQLRQSQKLRNQTQPSMLTDHATPDPATIPTQSHPSDGVVAPFPPTQESAKQTQPPTENIATIADTTNTTPILTTAYHP